MRDPERQPNVPTCEHGKPLIWPCLFCYMAADRLIASLKKGVPTASSRRSGDPA